MRLRKLVLVVNCTRCVRSANDMSNCCDTMTTSSYLLVGMMGDVVSGRADYGLSEFSVDLHRSLFVDYTASFRSTSYVIVSAKKPPSYVKAILQPFYTNVWILCVCSIVFFMVVSVALVHLVTPSMSWWQFGSICSNVLGKCNSCMGSRTDT